MPTKRFPLVRVKQWLDSWDESKWSPEEGLGKPAPHFYVGSIPIRELRRMSGIARRTVAERKKPDGQPGYQRGHDAQRSDRIRRYIQLGYPLSTQKGLKASEHPELIHPGWLPTAILVNIVGPNETRRRGGKTLTLPEERAIRVLRSKKTNSLSLSMPDVAGQTGPFLEPLEIIDGQHRIFAVDDDLDVSPNYEVPVVFFRNLSPEWQAYLFWVINVEPRKINASLAFDLYPELRSQSWLERQDAIKIYQEHRSQEITEILWRHKRSPWQDRIELLGNRVDGHVSNAAFIRSIVNTFVRKWGSESRIGGLFGSKDSQGKKRILPWNRAQQAAFVILIWAKVHKSARKCKADWAEKCRKAYQALPLDQRTKVNPHSLDAAFAGPHTLLATDQGVRAVHFVFNAVSQCAYEDVGLETWEVDGEPEDTTSQETIDFIYQDLEGQIEIVRFVETVADSLFSSDLDWRTSSEPSLSGDAKQIQASYRGSSGYSTLQRAGLKSAAKSKDDLVAKSASLAIELVSRDE